MDAQSALALFSKELLAYDSHVGQNDMFYYNLPYYRNYELTNSIPLAPVSGNIIKFYQYQMGKPVVIFTDVVDTTAAPVPVGGDSEEDAEDIEESLADELYDEDGNLRELSEEEMAALLTADPGDPEEEVYDKAPSHGPAAEDFSDEEVYDKAPSREEPSDWKPEEF